MSAQLALFAVPPSLTDVSDHLNLADARARFYAAELKGDAALAAWARTYAPPLLDRADDALQMDSDLRDARGEIHALGNGGLNQSDVDDAVNAWKSEASDRVALAVARIDVAKKHAAEQRTSEVLGELNLVVRHLKPLIIANTIVATKA